MSWVMDHPTNGVSYVRVSENEIIFCAGYYKGTFRIISKKSEDKSRKEYDDNAIIETYELEKSGDKFTISTQHIFGTNFQGEKYNSYSITLLEGKNMMYSIDFLPKDIKYLSEKLPINGSELTEDTIYLNKNFRVLKDKVYFYRYPDFSTVRKAFLIKGDVVKSIKQYKNFIYAQYTNHNNKTTKGWLPANELE